jgi:hypothetical protein
MQPASETDELHRVVYLCVTKEVFPEAVALGVKLLGGYRFIESTLVRVYFIFLS